jgi:hypothetical protein
MKYGQRAVESAAHLFSAAPMKWDLCDNLIFGWRVGTGIILYLPFPVPHPISFYYFYSSRPPSL